MSEEKMTLVEEISSWSEDLKSGILTCFTIIVVVTVLVTAILLHRMVRANETIACLEQYTPHQCAVMKLTVSELKELED